MAQMISSFYRNHISLHYGYLVRWANIFGYARLPYEVIGKNHTCQASQQKRLEIKLLIEQVPLVHSTPFLCFYDVGSSGVWMCVNLWSSMP